jgi:hypothetical protein
MSEEKFGWWRDWFLMMERFQARVLVRGVRAKPPIFTNRIRSQKNSLFVSKLRVFLGGRRRASEGLVCLYTPYKRLPEGGDVSTRLCKGCKGKTPHFYQSDQISKKLSFVSKLRVFLGGRRKASEGLVCLYTPYKFPCWTHTLVDNMDMSGTRDMSVRGWSKRPIEEIGGVDVRARLVQETHRRDRWSGREGEVGPRDP